MASDNYSMGESGIDAKTPLKKALSYSGISVNRKHCESKNIRDQGTASAGAIVWNFYRFGNLFGLTPKSV